MYAPRQAKKKTALKHVQNAQIQINLNMRKVSSGLLLYIRTICSIQWFC